jgi:hypothetical protein
MKKRDAHGKASGTRWHGLTLTLWHGRFPSAGFLADAYALATRIAGEPVTLASPKVCQRRRKPTMS